MYMKATALPMRKLLTLTLLVGWLGMLAAQNVQAQELIEDRTKLAQTGMQFLSVSLDPRAAAMGSAMTAQDGAAISMFYNPAAMGYQKGALDVHLGQNQWISDIKYNFGAVSFRPANGAYGTVGVSLMSVSYGELLETVRVDNTQGFEDLGTFSPSSMAIGVGYAKALTDRFSVGTNLKWAHQSLGAATMELAGESGASPRREENSIGTMVVDFGVLYRTGFRSLNFAASIRNFSQELTYAEESFELPLAFRIGLSMDMADVLPLNSQYHSFKVAVDALHPRDNVEQVAIGGEYLFMDTIALRTGFRGPTAEQGLSLGAGLKHVFGDLGFGFDYAYQDFGLFSTVHRLGLRLNLK